MQQVGDTEAGKGEVHEDTTRLFLVREAHQRILARLRRFTLPTTLPPDISTDAIMSALRTDKKFAAGNVRFVLCPRIGSAFVSKNITLEEIRDAVEKLR